MLLNQMTIKNNRAEIVSFSGPNDLVERLQEFGLRIGLEVTYVGRAPFAGPFLFRVGGMVLALRQEEAACTQITLI